MSSQTPANESSTPSSGDSHSNSSNNREGQHLSSGGVTSSSSSSNTGANVETQVREIARGLDPEMAYYHSFLNKLLSLISNGESDSVARVISVIRSGASQSQILEVIDQETSEGSGRANGETSSRSYGRGV